jgi:hypothetical protein
MEDAKEVKIPLALIVVGLAIFVVFGFHVGGAAGVAAALAVMAVRVVIGVTLGVIACFITARIMDASFGYLNTAILKLAAIFIVTGAVSAIIPLAGWLVGLVLYYGLLTWFFDLEILEVIVLSVVLGAAQIVAGVFAIGLIGALFGRR